MIGGIAIFMFVVGSGLAAHTAAVRIGGAEDSSAQLYSLSAALAAGVLFLAAA